MKFTIQGKYLALFVSTFLTLYIVLNAKRYECWFKSKTITQIQNSTDFSELESWATGRLTPKQNKGGPRLQLDDTKNKSSIPTTGNKFTILFLSSWHRHDPSKFLRIPECDDEFEILSNHSEIDRADAVVFSYAYFDHMENGYLSMTYRAIRNPNVAFVLSIQESEQHNNPIAPKPFDGIFNFIWMFRRDADIHHEFQKMYPKYKNPDDKWMYGSQFSYEFLRGKTSLAAWVVTNCVIQPGNRNGFVKELANHGIIVDVYGKCGNHTCEGNFKENNCFPTIGQEYKFYMALENSLCLDYITEKSAHGWGNGMVPIIWGLGTKELAAPPGSYIDATEFETIEELAARIKYLDKNPKEYFKYFEWRRVYNTSLTYHNTYHCYASRKIRELTMELREKVAANASAAVVHKNLEYWRAFFYNEKLKMYCKNCVEEGVNVTHPKQNIVRLYNNPSKCKEKLD